MTKLSDMILHHIKDIINGRSVTWEWVEENTFFVDWWRRARELEDYHEALSERMKNKKFGCLDYPENKPKSNGYYTVHVAEILGAHDEDDWRITEWFGDEWKLFGVRIDKFVPVLLRKSEE